MTENKGRERLVFSKEANGEQEEQNKPEIRKESGTFSIERKLAQAEARAEELERELNRMKREAQAAALLEELNMPSAFAEFLAGETEQETDDRVDRFSEEFNRAVSGAVRKKTPGYSPMEGEREIRDDFLRGFYRRGN